jgi:UDP-glucose 4-epimerase
MKLLVTGGAGFIGSHLTDALVNQGHDVTVLDDLSTGRLSNIQHLLDRDAIRFVRGSVLDESLVLELVSTVDRVFHLAAAVGVQRVVERSLESLLNNISGTEVVLRAAHEASVEKIVVFSSSEVYGKGGDRPLRETDDSVLGASCVSRWGYAASKAVDEFMALAYHREKQLPVVVVRCFNTCGPRQVGAYGMVIPRFVRQALDAEPMTVFGDGTQSRCFSYVGDVVRGVLMLSESKRAEGEVFNIGTDYEVTVLELAERIRTIAGSDSEIRRIPYHEIYDQPFEDVQRRVPDLAKISSTVGYRPEVDLDTLLERTIRHIQAEFVAEGNCVGPRVLEELAAEHRDDEVRARSRSNGQTSPYEAPAATTAE